jgi:hypothetical protein
MKTKLQDKLNVYLGRGIMLMCAPAIVAVAIFILGSSYDLLSQYEEYIS